MKIPFVALFAFALAACGGASQPAPPLQNAPAPAADTQHDGPTAKKLVEGGALLFDVRSPEEYAQGHIEGAQNFPVDTIGSADLGPKDRKIVVYCGSGKRAARAATTLRSQGRDVYELGGMSSWPR